MLAPFLTAKLALVVPVLLSTTSIILCALCLSAGHSEGFLEDYAIARLNTSAIGYTLLDFVGKHANSQENTKSNNDGPLGKIGNALDDVKQDLSDAVSGLADRVMDKAVDALDISEWYSLHVMTTCEGSYQSNSEAQDAELNVTKCSDVTFNNRLDLIESLNHYLSISPVKLDMDIADMDWLKKIQDAINSVNNVLRGLFAFYILTTLFILVNIASSIVVFLVSTPLLNVVSLASSLLAALSSIVASIMITVALTRGINALNDIGEKFGVYGVRGGRFLALTWVVSGLMVGATGLYFALMRRTREDNVLQWEMAKPEGSLGSDEKANNDIHQIQPQQPQSQHRETFTYERRN